MPNWRAVRGVSRATCLSANQIEPRSGRSTPLMIRISVLLPAPLSPTRARISPGRTSIETSWTAQMAPKYLVIPSHLSISLDRHPCRGTAPSLGPALSDPSRCTPTPLLPGCRVRRRVRRPSYATMALTLPLRDHRSSATVLARRRRFRSRRDDVGKAECLAPHARAVRRRKRVRERRQRRVGICLRDQVSGDHSGLRHRLTEQYSLNVALHRGEAVPEPVGGDRLIDRALRDLLNRLGRSVNRTHEEL